MLGALTDGESLPDLAPIALRFATTSLSTSSLTPLLRKPAPDSFEERCRSVGRGDEGERSSGSRSSKVPRANLAYKGGDADEGALSGKGNGFVGRLGGGDVAAIGTEASKENEGNVKEGGKSRVLSRFLFGFSLFLRMKFIVDVDDVDVRPC